MFASASAGKGFGSAFDLSLGLSSASAASRAASAAFALASGRSLSFSFCFCFSLSLAACSSADVLGDARGELVEPAEAVAAPLDRRDHRDVEQLAGGQVLERVLVRTAADLDRDRDRHLVVIGQEPFDPRLVLEVERAVRPPKLLEPVVIGDEAWRDARREGGEQVRLVPAESAAPLGALRPVGQDGPLLHAEVEIDVLGRFAEGLHHRDGRDRELTTQLRALDLRPDRPDRPRHRVAVDAGLVQGSLGRAADPDRPLIDLDRELRTVLGAPESGGEGESDDQQKPANSGAGRVRGSSHGLLVDGVLDDRSGGAAATVAVAPAAAGARR